MESAGEASPSAEDINPALAALGEVPDVTQKAARPPRCEVGRERNPSPTRIFFWFLVKSFYWLGAPRCSHRGGPCRFTRYLGASAPMRGMRMTATPRGLAGQGRSAAHGAEKTITA